MPKLSKTSKARLATCDSRLQLIFNEVAKIYDIVIICGHRNKEEQNKVYNEGLSKVKWPNGKHNKKPSLAVDVAPYPLDWKNIKSYYFLAGLVFGILEWANADLTKQGAKPIKLRWGGDWDMDKDFKDQNFNDLVHFEIVE